MSEAQEQALPQQEANGDTSILDEYNLFYTELSRILHDFNSDIEQIKLLLSDTVVKMPSGYDESSERNAETFERIFNEMDGKGDDEVAMVVESEGTKSITKRDLRSIVSLTKNVILKAKRNRNFLHIVAFNHLVSLFDATMQDLAEALFKQHPFAMVPHAKGATLPTMNYVDILNATSIDYLKGKMMEKELETFGRLSIREQIIFFNKILCTDFLYMQKQQAPIDVDKQLIGSVVEMRETRNVHVHNKGLVNRQYQGKVREYYDEVNKGEKDASKHLHYMSPDGSYAGLGKFREITDRYIEDSIWKLIHLANAIRTSFIDKFISVEEQGRIQSREQEYWARQRVIAASVVPSPETSIDGAGAPETEWCKHNRDGLILYLSI